MPARGARTRAALSDLRHTFASHWMMNGGDLYVLKDILGHKSVAMTQRYAHLSPAYKRAMVIQMESMWSSQPRSTVRPSGSENGYGYRYRSRHGYGYGR